MAQELFQFGLAVLPAISLGVLINKVSLPWQKKKRFSERAELLCLLARDVRRAKSIMARAMESVNSGRVCRMPSLPLSNWRKLKQDERLRKYASEPIFQTMIRQFREWERV